MAELKNNNDDNLISYFSVRKDLFEFLKFSSLRNIPKKQFRLRGMSERSEKLFTEMKYARLKSGDLPSKQIRTSQHRCTQTHALTEINVITPLKGVRNRS